MDGSLSPSSNAAGLTTYQLSKDLTLYHFKQPVESTQDEASRLLLERFANSTVNNQEQDADSALDDTDTAIVVIADSQIKGRGTQGRTWELANQDNHNNKYDPNKSNDNIDERHNLYMTLALPMDKIPTRLTLLPLQIAVTIAQHIQNTLSNCQQDPSSVKVKWPNDVLVKDAKISGTLIENLSVGATTYLLIGMGVNVAYTPPLQNSPGKQIRPATNLYDECLAGQPQGTTPNVPTALDFGSHVASALVEWVGTSSSTKTGQRDVIKEQKVINQWKSLAAFGKAYELRGQVAEENKGSYQGEIVTPIDIQDDGQLVVVDQKGQQRTLVAEYMF